jgi:hypothetical protein
MCNGGVVPTETSLSWKRITPPKHILSYKCSRYLEYEDIIVIFLVSTDHGAHLENVELLNYVSLGSWIFGRIFVCGCQEILSILWKKSSFAWSWISPIEMWGMKDLRTMHDSLLIYLLNVACQRYATVCQLLVAWKNGHYSLVLCVWHATDTAPLNISY